MNSRYFDSFIPGGKFTKNYNYNSSSKIVTVNESDIDIVLMIINSDTGEVIYNPLSSKTSGFQNGNIVTLGKNSNLGTDTKSLLIYYQKADSKAITTTLQAINEKLNKIYSLLECNFN